MKALISFIIALILIYILFAYISFFLLLAALCALAIPVIMLAMFIHDILFRKRSS
jgi:hypothetical protein